jgi:hypothetical protein
VTVTVTGVNTYTYTVGNTGPSTDQGSTMLARLKVFNHASLVSVTSRANGSLNYPVRAVRLYNSAWSAGFSALRVLQGSAA